VKIIRILSPEYRGLPLGFSASFVANTRQLHHEVTEQPKDFRPVSLVHSFAKLVTKIMTNRLAGRLNEMVFLIQSGFIKGRFIQDNFMPVLSSNDKVSPSTKAAPTPIETRHF
jgi:hypothetical protein